MFRLISLDEKFQRRTIFDTNADVSKNCPKYKYNKSSLNCHLKQLLPVQGIQPLFVCLKEPDEGGQCFLGGLHLYILKNREVKIHLLRNNLLQWESILPFRQGSISCSAGKLSFTPFIAGVDANYFSRQFFVKEGLKKLN